MGKMRKTEAESLIRRFAAVHCNVSAVAMPRVVHEAALTLLAALDGEGLSGKLELWLTRWGEVQLFSAPDAGELPSLPVLTLDRDGLFVYPAGVASAVKVIDVLRAVRQLRSLTRGKLAAGGKRKGHK